jgi:hypothetical protein
MLICIVFLKVKKLLNIVCIYSLELQLSNKISGLSSLEYSDITILILYIPIFSNKNLS